MAWCRPDLKDSHTILKNYKLYDVLWTNFAFKRSRLSIVFYKAGTEYIHTQKSPLWLSLRLNSLQQTQSWPVVERRWCWALLYGRLHFIFPRLQLCCVHDEVHLSVLNFKFIIFNKWFSEKKLNLGWAAVRKIIIVSTIKNKKAIKVRFILSFTLDMAVFCC